MPVIRYDQRRDEAHLPEPAYLLRDGVWEPCTILRVAGVRRAPFLGIRGYAEVPIYEVSLENGNTLRAGVLELRARGEQRDEHAEETHSRRQI